MLSPCGLQVAFLRRLGRRDPSSLAALTGFPVVAQKISGPYRLPGSCPCGSYDINFRGRQELRASFGLHWTLASSGGPFRLAESSRSFSGGKQKCGETAKEKRARRMLKKLNRVSEEDTQPRENTGDWRPPEQRQQARRGREGEKDKGGFDSKKVEAEAASAVAAAQQQMNGHLMNLCTRLKELDVARPKLDTFEEIRLQAAGSSRRLGDLAQVQIKGNSVVVITIFSEQHLSKVVSALRRTDENWRIVEEGPVTVRVQLPKMTEELRASFIAQAKAVTEQCRVQIRRVRQDTRAKHRSLFKDSRTSEDTKRNEEQQLQKITDDAVKQAAQFLADKLKQLADASH
ncbi:ribosome recycling factor domain-containing protein, putative [Eimeria brunetti]|uniref:Ribosome recycling factor domain-containing protein, putative n=1 Tax=Eimeria brunetti TaxID=51314 RepID=U6LN90_9EIME|nr:ribosome recycling factor domain-containing protein, putative [Eimeria brunetti]